MNGGLLIHFFVIEPYCNKVAGKRNEFIIHQHVSEKCLIHMKEKDKTLSMDAL